MNFDWNAIGAISTAIGSIATAVGVCFGAWQIHLTRKQSLTEFEDSLDQQYRSLSMGIPVEVLIGNELSDDKYPAVRELIYNYLDLSNEQIYLRSKGRISEHTWKSWSAGIREHLNRPVFQKVYREVTEASGFSYLEKLVDAEFRDDPYKWC